MIILDSIDKSLEVVLASSVATELPVVAFYGVVDFGDSSLSALSENDTQSNGTTAVTAVPAPEASQSYGVKYLGVYNANSVATTVIVRLNNSTTTRILRKKTLQPGETLYYQDGLGWSGEEKKNQVISELNTTTQNLLSGQAFLGIGERVDYPDVIISCQTDQPGTLYFQFSNDNINWNSFPTNGFQVEPGFHEFHQAVKAYRYFRAYLVNSFEPQTYLRLYTYYGTYGQLNAPLYQQLGSDADATVVRTFETQVDLALGNLGGVESGDKFGYAEELGTSIQLSTPSSWVDLWAAGGLRTSPVASFTPWIASDDAADIGIDFIVTYLDAFGVEQTATVTLNGTTPVSVGVTATEAFRLYNDDSTETAGNVWLATTSDFSSGVPDNQNEILVMAPAIDQQSQVLAARIPSNKQAIVTNISLEASRASGADTACDLAFQTRLPGKVWRTIRKYQITNSSDVNKKELIVLEPSTDYRVRIRDVSDNDTTISGVINLIFIDLIVPYTEVHQVSTIGELPISDESISGNI